jgi:hypothetical protein
MTKHNHNKKRNVGVIHEQLVRYIGSAIISGEEKSAEKAVSIVTKHFKPGTELHKEFRLFNALVNMPLGDKELAKLVIAEAKNAAKLHDKMKLSQEKSSLIKMINYTLDENKFYDIRVPTYKLYATVQSLFDSWRGSTILEIHNSAKYEMSLIEWISRKEEEVQVSTVEQDPLVYKIMLKKFKEKYGNTLLPAQKKVVEAALTKDSKSLLKELELTRQNAVSSLKEFKTACSNNVLLEKIDKVIKNVESFNSVDESTNLSRTLQLLELVSELKGENDE